jgi:hypothetical protein
MDNDNINSTSDPLVDDNNNFANGGGIQSLVHTDSQGSVFKSLSPNNAK